MKKLHFVDMDRTLVRTNLSCAFGKHLFEQGLFSHWQVVRFLAHYIAHDYLWVSLHALHHSTFPFLLQGMDFFVLKDIAKKWLSSYLHSVLNVELYSFLLQKQEKGDIVMIGSSSPEFLVAALAQQLDIARYVGTRYALDGLGRMLSIECVIDGNEKARICLGEERVTVYTDSIQDLPVLEAAHHPIAVSPDRRLRKICVQRNWPIFGEPCL